jgi:hypothetical protein
MHRCVRYRGLPHQIRKEHHSLLQADGALPVQIRNGHKSRHRGYNVTLSAFADKGKSPPRHDFLEGGAAPQPAGYGGLWRRPKDLLSDAPDSADAPRG